MIEAADWYEPVTRLLAFSPRDRRSAERIETIRLHDGRYGIALWRCGRHWLLISDRVAPGDVAQVVRHLIDQHGPDVDDASWEITFCQTSCCAQARAWDCEAALGTVAGL